MLEIAKVKSLETIFVRSAWSASTKHTSLDSQTRGSIVSSTLSDYIQENTKIGGSVHCRWYADWICTKIRTLPEEILETIQDVRLLFEVIQNGAKERHSLDKIARDVLDRRALLASNDEDDMKLARTIVFAFLGWQSMLYEADIISTIGSLRLADTLDGYSSHTFFRLRPNQPQTDRPLATLLLDYGLMLPERNFCTSEDAEDCEAFDKIETVTPTYLNAAALSNIAHFKFKWVDTLAPHLELDKATNTIFLYRWPSFCIANIQSSKEDGHISVLHSLAAPEGCSSSWASPEDVTQLLEEIVLSFRLLFGQTATSRKFFRSRLAEHRTSTHKRDDFLFNLCARGQGVPEATDRDKSCYRLARDFPVLRERIAILQHQLTIAKPRGWLALWRDTRDSAQWYTFWAVIMFGSLATLLSIMQTVLAFVQTFQQH